MRVLAVTNRDAVAESPAAATGSCMLSFFDVPALLHIKETPLAMTPQTLLLCRPTTAAHYQAIAESAAFTVSFDPADAPVPLADEAQCIALTAADAPPDQAQFYGIGVQLADVFFSRMAQPLKNTVCCALLSALLTMYEAVVQYRCRDAARHHNRTRLIALRQTIYRDPAASWSIEQMCAQVNVSRTHLHRIYQETFGVGCHTDVLQSRLLHAADMLIGSDAPVREIALACGFENDITFMRAFKKHQGCTPTTYRRAWSASSKCTSRRP